MMGWLAQKIANVKLTMGSVKAKHLSVFLLTSVIMFDTCVKLSSSQLQQYVHFLPINNWNCSDEMEKICAVDTASEMMNTSSLTECTMRCMMNRDRASSSTTTTRSHQNVLCTISDLRTTTTPLTVNITWYVLCIYILFQWCLITLRLLSLITTITRKPSENVVLRCIATWSGQTKRQTNRQTFSSSTLSWRPHTMVEVSQCILFWLITFLLLINYVTLWHWFLSFWP